MDLRNRNLKAVALTTTAITNILHRKLGILGNRLRKRISQLELSQSWKSFFIFSYDIDSSPPVRVFTNTSTSDPSCRHWAETCALQNFFHSLIVAWNLHLGP